MRMIIGAVFCTFLLWTVSGLADTEAPAVRLDVVLVTAERPTTDLQTGDVDPAGQSGFVSVIRREAFEGKSESLAEVIEQETGVQVRQTGGIGSFSSVSLRGSSSDQVIVFIDGILLNDASGGGVDLSHIALADVAAIEIYRGITPIHFGKASLGGVINIRTRRAQKGLTATASAGMGSFRTRTAGAFLNHKPNRWDYLLSFDHLGSDNDFDFINDGGTRWNPADDRPEKRRNAQVTQYNLLTKVGSDLTDTLRVDLLNQYFYKDQGIANWNNATDNRAGLDTRRNITTLRLIADDVTSLGLNTRTQLSYLHKQETYSDRGGHIGLGRQHATYTTKRIGADLFGEWLTRRHALITTAAWSSEDYGTEDQLDRQNPGDSRRTTFSAGLQDSIFLVADRLTLIPALRYTWVRDKRSGAVDERGIPLADTSRRDGYPAPQMGIQYQPRPWLILRTNMARYVREPSFFELFGDRGVIVGNPDLRKETGINFDAGAVANWQAPHAWLQRVTLSLAYFKNEADDLITRVYDARGIGKSVNISSARIQGVEAGAVFEFLGGLRAVVNVTWQDPRNHSDIAIFNNKKLPGRFEYAYLGRLEAGAGPFTVHVEYVYETDMYYDTANLLKAEDKSEFNAGLTWLWRSMRIAVTGRNLGDDRHEDFNGYPMPGRSFYVTVKYDFQ